MARSLACNKRIDAQKMNSSYHNNKILADGRTDQVVLFERYGAIRSVLTYSYQAKTAPLKIHMLKGAALKLILRAEHLTHLDI